MPPRNNPVPNAVRLFNCTICDKGYPRQLDYENHLRSYDHNHRQRLADMKKLTASNDPESNKPKAGLDMRSINVEESTRKTVTGGRFTKIGGGGAAVGGSRFKKVGVAVGGVKEETKEEKSKKESSPVVEIPDADEKVEKSEEQMPDADAEKKESANEDAVMAEASADTDITWEEYDFTKPTGCDHAVCSGCKTDGIWSGEWLAV